MVEETLVDKSKINTDGIVENSKNAVSTTARNSDKQYDFYLAGPYYRKSQIQSQILIEELFASYAKKVFSPRKDAFIESDNPTKEEMKQAYDDDMAALNDSEYILANVTFNDRNTAIQIGYALSKGIPVILYKNENLVGVVDEPISLMLAESCEFRILENTVDVINFLRDGKFADRKFKCVNYSYSNKVEDDEEEEVATKKTKSKTKRR